MKTVLTEEARKKEEVKEVEGKIGTEMERKEENKQFQQFNNN